MTDPLYRNSIFVMLSSFVLAFFGFLFWIFVARIFSVKSVGIATALISSVTLLSNFSLLGLNVGLVRYLPKSTQKNEKINSVLILVTFASVISSLIFIMGLHIFSPKLSFLQTNITYIVIFSMFVVAVSLNSILDSIFMAYRASGNILIKNFVLSILKLFFPLLFIFLGSYGIFTSVSVATLIGVFVGLAILFLRFSYQPSILINNEVVKKMAAFSGGNYVAGFLSQAPTLILPVLIINHLNAETAAYFYMDMMIMSTLSIISSSVTQSLLAEGSYDETELRTHFLKATKIIFTFLIPAVIIIIIFGNLILHAFGKNYASQAFTFLQLMSISSIFISIVSLGNAVLRIRRQVVRLIMVSILGDIIVLGFSYMFINKGLTEIGLGWLLGRVVNCLIYVFFLGKDIFNYQFHYINNLKSKFRLKFL